jgi:hypothetical protein
MTMKYEHQLFDFHGQVSRIQKKAERWILSDLLPAMFRQSFANRKVVLNWGGKFEFDAVSAKILI